jgi:cyclase
VEKWTRIGPSYVSGHTRFKEVPTFREGLYEVGKDLYTWMVPNGSWGESNAGLLIGDGESLLIDTLWDLKYTRRMLDAMKSLTIDNPIQTVINTHADGDHWWGNELVADAEIITSQKAYEEMQHIKPISMILLGRKLGKVLSFIGMKQVGHWFQNMVIPYDFQEVSPTLPSKTFEGELHLTVGGRDVHLIQVGPAHTQGDVIVHIPDLKTLFCSDILFIGSTPVMWAGPIENMFAALKKILQMDVDIFVPGHGPITDKSGVQGVLSYWEYVYQQSEQRYQAGMSAKDAAYDIVLNKDFSRRSFSAWNSPERMMTNVHTLYRQFKGRKDSPKIPELLNVLRKQAKLAHELPNAQPAIMRYR